MCFVFNFTALFKNRKVFKTEGYPTQSGIEKYQFTLQYLKQIIWPLEKGLNLNICVFLNLWKDTQPLKRWTTNRIVTSRKNISFHPTIFITVENI